MWRLWLLRLRVHRSTEIFASLQDNEIFRSISVDLTPYGYEHAFLNQAGLANQAKPA
jgi:hypothetical protein